MVGCDKDHIDVLFLQFGDYIQSRPKDECISCIQGMLFDKRMGFENKRIFHGH